MTQQRLNFASLSCPTCRSDVEDEGKLACAACGWTSQLLEDVLVLTDKSDMRLAEWTKDAAHLRGEMIDIEGRYKAALSGCDDNVLPQLKARLLRELQGRVELRKQLGSLLEPLTSLGLQPPPGFGENAQAARGHQRLTAYLPNVFRDWAWEDTTENEASLRAVSAAAGAAVTTPNGQVLVVGAGGGRLAYDLHQNSSAAITIACDVNPLYLLIGARVASGRSVQLVELPLGPDGLQAHAVPRRLKAPQKARAGLNFLLADGTRPPFREGSFDLIVAPWFFDILPHDAHDVLVELSRVLKPGGRFVYFGSTAFRNAAPEHNYSREEVSDIFTVCGFDVDTNAVMTLDYLASPASCMHRRERVLTLGATKVRQAPARRDANAHQPAWMRDSSLPIGTLPALEREARYAASVATLRSLIAEGRSAKDIAQLIATASHADLDKTLAGLLGFLAQFTGD